MTGLSYPFYVTRHESISVPLRNKPTLADVRAIRSHLSVAHWLPVRHVLFGQIQLVDDIVTVCFGSKALVDIFAIIKN